MKTYQQRSKNISFDVEVKYPDGTTKTLYNLYNVEHIADILNLECFNGFQVLTRSIVSNWLYSKHTNGDRISKYFNIYKRIRCN